MDTATRSIIMSHQHAIKLIVAAVLGLAALQLASMAPAGLQDVGQVEWWKKTNFYHIYIRSFVDTNGDGQGDIRGVIEKLDYLKQIGVDTLLLSPFYSSPMKDAGYDIDDFVGVSSQFGTMQDFDDLIAGVKARGMHLVVDYVPNHTSNNHEWFKCSERALIDPQCAKYKDYYVWSDSRRYNGQYPTNWVSVFGGGPAWHWSPVRNAFYLAQFLPEQPDLNFYDPLVREELKEVIRFWLRKGADGIRVDSASFIYEDTITWQDEPPNPNWKQGEDPYEKVLHTHTRQQPESTRTLRDWHEVVNEPEFEGQDKIVIIEAYDPIPQLIEDYGPNPREKYADMPFNFELMFLKQHDMENPQKLEQTISRWVEATRAMNWPDEKGAPAPWTCWVTGNHDNTRPINRVGEQNFELYKWLAHMAPGVPVNYYGDEIGLHDSAMEDIPRRTIEEGEPSRLPERAPMAWTPELPSGGFSSTDDVWVALNRDWKQNNVQTLLSQEKNFLKNFIALQKLRKEHMATFLFGDLTFFQSADAQSSVLAMARQNPQFGSIMMLANTNPTQSAEVHLVPSERSLIRHEPSEPPASVQVLLLNKLSTSESNPVMEGAQVQLDGLVLEPSQAMLVLY